MSVWLEPVVEAWREFYDGFDGHAVRVVDVGSRDGDDAAWLASQIGATEVICVEARSSAARAIKDKYPDFEVVQCAVGAEGGTADFLEFLGDDEGLVGSSSLNLGRAGLYGGNRPYQIIEVPVRRLDSLLPDHGWIDILKVDVEGYTREALIGLGERIDIVMVAHLETETKERAAYGEPANNVWVYDYMKSRGFSLYAVRYEWGPSIEDQTWVSGDLDFAFAEPEILR